MDDLDKKLRELKKDIKPSMIDNPTQIYSKCISNKKEKKNYFGSMNLLMKYVVSVLLITCIAVSAISILLHNGNEKYKVIYEGGSEGENLPADNSIKQVTSLEELKAIINNSGSSSSGLTGGFIEGFDKVEDSGMMVEPETPSYTVGNTNFNDTSIDIQIDTDRTYSTNNQVDGIDEADIVKVNGDYIYYIPGSQLYYSNEENVEKYVYILKASGKTVDVVHKFVYESKKTLVEETEGAKLYDSVKTTPKDLYCTDKFLIVSASTNIRAIIEEPQIIGDVKLTRSYSRDSKFYSEFYIYDINTYELVTTIKTAGTSVSTRLVDNELYVINNYVDYKNGENSYIPYWFLDDTLIRPIIGRIYYCPAIGVNITSYVIIYRITLNTEIKVEDFYFLAPTINNVYMSKDAIYLIKKYNNSIIEEKDNQRTSWSTSKVLVINVEDEITPDGLVVVKGQINDKYWIDEHNGYLRVATTGTKSVSKVIGKYTYSTTSEVFNYITIFEKDEEGIWQEISSITEGIGEPGETMRSARFNENVVTVVTFRNTDPLYYIDLTDPYNPKITSELKVTGYTVYQHPYKDNYVIGVGYEATTSGATNGYKVALFDVSDKTNIKQVGNALVFSSSEYSSPSVLSNTKSVMIDLSNELFGFSMTSKERQSEQYEYADGTKSRYKYTSNYFVFEVDETSENPIKIRLRESKVNFTAYSSSSESSVLRRMVFIKDKYYLLATDEIYVYNSKFEKIKTVDLK